MSAGLEIYNSVLNQLGSPAIYSATFANRPAAGYTGRLFVSTDTNELYRDTGTAWVLIGAGGGGGGITSLNSLTASSQVFATASTGSDFTISSSGFTHTFAIPDASLTARGLVTTSAQSFAGQKTFNTSTIIGSQTANVSHILSPGTNGLAWTGSTFGISSAIPSNTILISNTGTYSTLTGNNNLLLGTQAGITLTSGNSNVLIGRNAGNGITTGIENVIVAYNDATNFPAAATNVIHNTTGYRNNDASTIPATKHVFIGGGFNIAKAQTTFYFGQMPFTADAASVGITFHAPSGNGTDIAGASYTEAAGRGTGNGNGGQFNIATSTPGTTGSTLQTLTNRIQVAGTGAFIGIHQAPSTQAVAITGDTIVNNGYIQAADVYASVGSGGTYAIFSNNTVTYQNAFTTSAGVVYGGLVSSEIKNLNTGTIDQDSFVTGSFSGLYANFQVAGSTVTNTQAAGGIRSTAANTIYRQIRSGSTTGTFTHLSGLQINGIDNKSASAITITNGYGIIINSLTEYTGTATITNRWGIYQDGASDNNYFAGRVNVGSNSINTSAIVNITSTTAGFLMPRMTDTQKTSIGTPATGLMVYDTVNAAPSYYNGAAWVNLGTGGGGGITSLNGLTGATQTFATGSTGTDFNISSVGTTHTFNIPSASTTNRGLITTGTQTISGEKTIQGTTNTAAAYALTVTDLATAVGLRVSNTGVVQIKQFLQPVASTTLVIQGNNNTANVNISASTALSNNGIGLTNDIGVTASTGAGDILIQRITGTINQTGTSTSLIRGLYINNTFTSVTGTYRGLDILAPSAATNTLMTLRNATVTVISVASGGTITIGDACDIAVNTTTGTKIGTATTQKIGFWNVAPVAQPTTAVASATYASPGAGSTVKTDDTFDGYTLQQVVKALRNVGILA